MTVVADKVLGSFRDPNGFVFYREGQLLRQVNHCYRAHYDHLLASGLYARLVKQGQVVPHAEVSLDWALRSGAYKILQPEMVPFISYPYEWCFGQLKDAALTTLAIQRQALEHGLTLKDASAYNLQFWQGRPTLIDTLSFEIYEEGHPWVAYRQFCQHFLAPLALMSYTDVRLSQLLRVYVDGMPLDLATRLLPWRSRLNLSLALHLHLHAANQQRATRQDLTEAATPMKSPRLGRQALLNLVENLEAAVQGVKWAPPTAVGWADYYVSVPSYTPAALKCKQRLVAEFVRLVSPRLAWDLGANTGMFSQMVNTEAPNCLTVAWDSEPACVETAYQRAGRASGGRLLPLVLDLTNPSPGLGWRNAERMSLRERGPVDLVLALALIHHLAIANNVPLGHVADFLADLGRWLIVEFVPKDDAQVRRLLATRADIFDAYTQAEFEAEFGRRFAIRRDEPVEQSGRRLYLMEEK